MGGLAQLARAPALHAGGHRFDSDILHQAIHRDPLEVIYCIASNAQRYYLLCFAKFIDILGNN